MAIDSYVIRGGIQGFERLKVLARVMHPTTTALFDRVGVGPGMRCLDVGCGSGDVTFELARRVGMDGHVVGADLDDVKLDLARRDAANTGLRNVEFRNTDASDMGTEAAFDLIYARYLLTHLVDPASAVAAWRRLLRPGGVIVLEDMDASGMFCEPPNASYAHLVELYARTVQSRGADPNIGPRLPGMLMAAGLTRVQVHVVQPAGIVGEVKLLPALTLQNIVEAVLAANLATREEMAAHEAELLKLATDSHTLIAGPRVVQTWGRRAD